RWLELGPLEIHPRTWMTLVGTSAQGRKGTAAEVVDRALRMSEQGALFSLPIDPDWSTVTGIIRSLNSAEGAVQALLATEVQEVRAFYWEGEFVTAIHRAIREGSTL